jgi:putative restriction endonuclease
MKAIFQTKVDPAYDDDPGTKYHFPKIYLKRVEATVGDSIIYYETSRLSTGSRRGGRMAYFAVARVNGIRPDELNPDHFYADISNYLQFLTPVAFKDDDKFYETSMSTPDGKVSQGAARAAVRHLPDHEFEKILEAGFGEDPKNTQELEHTYPDGFHSPPMEIIRPRTLMIYERPFRDRVFAQQIQKAYENRCAITGIRIINGGGRAEAQAAHIKPVEENGPDHVRNGIALSGTVHWMFDRGLISLSDDLKILKAKGHVPAEIERMLNPEGYMKPPTRAEFSPHPAFLQWHRENRFKG